MTVGSTPADSREMIAVHDMFRREFAVFPSLIENVTPGDTKHATVVTEHLAFVTRLLHAHHNAEDALLWPKLEERAPEDVAPLLASLRKDHSRIDERTAVVSAKAAAWRSAVNSRGTEDLLDALGELTPLLHEHLSDEEAGALSLIDIHLSAAEWAEVGRHGLTELPPDSHVLLFGMLLYNIDAELYELVRGTVPPEIFEAASVAGPQAYARQRLLLRGTARP
ncbi:hemerythrin domain-containing protein [Streptomyces sp. NPDC057718]|uniref:hemerythrin domain-containing protein n=1 Tax=Streptomyces sp. NPDC057718 TaxID=3346225 RepID=UPI0036811355